MKTVQCNIQNWNIKCNEGGLATSTQNDQIGEKCNLFRSPTIIFHHNQIKIIDKEGRITLTYNAVQALKYTNYQVRQKFYVSPSQQPQINTISYIPGKLQVKHADHWKNITKPKDIQITQIKQQSDSFFLNTFKGYLEGANIKIQKVKQSVIPLQKLGQHNPITFYHQGSMYEDQLDDNGLIQYQYKFRTMNGSWFGLIRNYARIDEVTVQIYDTRIYWQSGWTKIARQFNVKTALWSDIKLKQGQLPQGWRMNPNQSHFLYPFMNQIFVQNEYIHYN